MNLRHSTFALLFAVGAAGPVAAQTAPAPQPAATEPEADDGGLTGSVSDESEWQDLGIAITAFSTDRDVPTQTNAGSTAQLGNAISQVIASDLKNNGLFKPSGPAGLPRPTMMQVQQPDYPTWGGMGADMLVEGYVKAGADGSLTARVIWRPGGTRDASRVWETFGAGSDAQNLARADGFKRMVEAAGQRWPDGWVKGGRGGPTPRPPRSRPRFLRLDLLTVLPSGT